MDQLLKGMVKDKSFLVVALISTQTVDRARSIHDTYPTASAAFGRMISGALLLASLLKDGQKVILQVMGDGPLKEIVVEADWLCRARGYVRHPHVHRDLRNGKLDVGGAIGKGTLNVIKDLGVRDYYQGTVPLQTGEIATDLAHYLTVSEQVPSAVSLGVYVDVDNSVGASGGFMVYALPGMSEETTTRLEERLRKLRPVSSMILDGLGPREIMEEAIGLPIALLEKKEVCYFCPCDKSRVLDAIVALGEQEIRDLIRKAETANVQCHFCKKEYAVGQEELLLLLKAIEFEKRPPEA